MYRIHLVGAGAVGSAFAKILARRAYVLSTLFQLFIYDSDIVEPRNVAAQEFDPTHLGMNKAEAVELMLAPFLGDRVKAMPMRVDLSYSLTNMGGEDDVIIDAVDNVDTRQALWNTGIASGVPVMHLQLSAQGFGLVTWNTKEFDNFPLSPKVYVAPETPEDTKLKPCELNTLQSLIWLTGMCGADALYIYLWGLDTKMHLGTTLQNEAVPGAITSWNITPLGVTQQKGAFYWEGAEEEEDELHKEDERSVPNGTANTIIEETEQEYSLSNPSRGV